MRVSNYKLLTNQPMNTNINSPPQQLDQIFGYSVQAEYTGSSINGTFKLQASSDPVPQANVTVVPAVPMNWTDITGSPFTVNSAGSYMWNVSDVEYNWVRLVYTDASSGSSNGVVSAIINCKGF